MPRNWCCRADSACSIRPAAWCSAASRRTRRKSSPSPSIPARRRGGLGRALLAAAEAHVGRRRRAGRVPGGVEENAAARALYAAAGYREIGRRSRYYPDGTDALVLARPLRPRRSHSRVDPSGSVDEALAVLQDFGAPVAVKGCSADVAHKSELGIVRLNVGGGEALRTSFAEIKAALETRGAAFDGVIVARMANGGREMMIGAHRDAVFGPVIAIGDGGKYVEIMPDVQLLLPPVARDDVLHALSKLRIAPLLMGVRGEPPLAVDAYVEAVLGVSRLMMEPRRGIASIDLNPVMLDARGCMAVDAVVFQAEKT